MKKNNLLIMLAFLCLSLASFGQTPTGFLMDLEILEHGSYNKFDIKDEHGRTIGQYLFEKMPNGQTRISLKLPHNTCNGIKLDYIRNKEVFFTDIIGNGPNACSYPVTRPEIVDTEYWFNNNEDDGIIIGFLTVAYCCVKIEVTGETSVDEDGCVTTSSTFSLGFDCDCLNFDLSIVGSDGTNHEGVDIINLTII